MKIDHFENAGLCNKLENHERLQGGGNMDDNTYTTDLKQKMIGACKNIVSNNSKIFTKGLLEELC